MTLLPLLQVAQPPLPPQAPMPNPWLHGSDLENVVIGVVVVAIATAVFFLVKPLVIALARRIEARGGDQALRADLEHVREQLAEVEPLRTRMADLEERLEFAERLLSQRRDQELLPRQGGPS